MLHEVNKVRIGTSREYGVEGGFRAICRVRGIDVNE